MSQGGLQRRRVGGGGGGGSTSPALSRQNSDYGASSPVAGSGSSELRNGTSGGAGSATPRGEGRIAFDPRDLDTSSEEKEYPLLTLMEEVLLMGLKDKQGYLSFWNDNISYALRGCILTELALRRRIAVVRDPNRRRFELSDRLIEVIDDRLTGEVLLDEALKLMKVSEKLSIGSWIDLMSGETWNVMKIGYQLKQVRERLAKGLVDKGVLRTEKKNFLLFDMATHPVSDASHKRQVVQRIVTLASPSTVALDLGKLYPDPAVKFRATRAVAVLLSGYAASVLENALAGLSYDAREEAFMRTDEILNEFAGWPWGSGNAVGSSGRARREASTAVGSGGSGRSSGAAAIAALVRAAKEDIGEHELQFEVVAGVFSVFGKMDSLL